MPSPTTTWPRVLSAPNRAAHHHPSTTHHIHSRVRPAPWPTVSTTVSSSIDWRRSVRPFTSWTPTWIKTCPSGIAKLSPATTMRHRARLALVQRLELRQQLTSRMLKTTRTTTWITSQQMNIMAWIRAVVTQMPARSCKSYRRNLHEGNNNNNDHMCVNKISVY